MYELRRKSEKRICIYIYLHTYIYIYMYTNIYKNVHTLGSIKILTEAFAITGFMLVASSTALTPLLTSKVPYAPKVT